MRQVSQKLFYPRISANSEPHATILHDASRWGYNGTFYADGKPDWVQLPTGLWVMDFNGTDSYVNLGTSADQNLFSFTLMAWVCPDVVASWRRIINDQSGWFEIRIANNSAFQIEIWNGSSWGALGGGPVFSVNSWAFCVATYDFSTTTANLYYNTSLTATSSTLSASRRNGTLYIGGGQASEYFDGKIALPKIYRYVMSQPKFEEIYEKERGWFGV
jgi:hypothetical protein